MQSPSERDRHSWRDHSRHLSAYTPFRECVAFYSALSRYLRHPRMFLFKTDCRVNTLFLCPLSQQCYYASAKPLSSYLSAPLTKPMFLYLLSSCSCILTALKHITPSSRRTELADSHTIIVIRRLELSLRFSLHRAALGA